MADGVVISERAKTYEHRVPYAWGGASPRGWDCSGFVNYLLCHDLGYNIPGYRGHSFSGAQHGPNTTIWLTWSGLRAKSRASVARGDLIIWPTHMGIAVGNQYYISAYDTQLGTVIEPIHGGGPYGETATFWNLRQPAPAGARGGGGGGGRGQPPPPKGPRPNYDATLRHWGLLQHMVGPGARDTWNRFHQLGQQAQSIGR